MSGSKRHRSKSSSRVKGARNPQVRTPRVKIIKRDGRIEQFNRIKMINSIRTAGATQREANLVTNRVSNRMMRREPIPSKEVSTMVARSLSHVNPTASRNYAASRDRKLAYNKRVNQLSTEITSINKQTDMVTNRIENLDKRIQGLAGRITRVRQGNFRVLTHLETEQSSLSEAWVRLSPELRTTSSLKGEIVRTRIRDLQQALAHKLGGANYNLGNLQEIESGIPELRLGLSEMQNSVVSALSPLEKKFEEIDKDLRSAESTLSIVEGASFPWEESETPILAIKAKDLNNDREGFITLTNLHFIFEHEKEIALKKMLFVVTEKKTIREVIIQKPIGMVTGIVKGKVGFFKGSGLFVQFTSETGIPEMKFDTSGKDADWVTKSYNYIISGQAEKELAAVTPEAKEEKEVPQLVICPVCGAPYREKIYRGQTSINCKYCGAVVSIK
jgi:transcriptional regulator NrdR family protein